MFMTIGAWRLNGITRKRRFEYMKKKPKIVSYHRVGTKKQIRPDIGDLLNEQKIEGINCVIPQKSILGLAYSHQNIEKQSRLCYNIKYNGVL